MAGLALCPGALFTALRLIRPDRSIVITSDLARGTLEETLRRAQQANLPAECVIMAEPFVGFAEAADIVTRVRPILAEAGEVVANLSGGSTVIQYVVDCIAIEAIRLNVHTRRVAAVDRRGMEKQRAEPYVLGEIVDIEDTGLRRDD